MADTKASNVMILLVVFVVVLSVAFTWNVLSEQSSDSNTEQTSAGNTDSGSATTVAPQYETSGRVGVNIQTEEGQ